MGMFDRRMLATCAPREIINEFMKFGFVRFRLFNRALRFEQDDRLQVNLIFLRRLPACTG